MEKVQYRGLGCEVLSEISVSGPFIKAYRVTTFSPLNPDFCCKKGQNIHRNKNRGVLLSVKYNSRSAIGQVHNLAEPHTRSLSFIFFAKEYAGYGS